MFRASKTRFFPLAAALIISDHLEFIIIIRLEGRVPPPFSPGLYQILSSAMTQYRPLVVTEWKGVVLPTDEYTWVPGP